MLVSVRHPIDPHLANVPQKRVLHDERTGDHPAELAFTIHDR
jgi:hypothetical protein